MAVGPCLFWICQLSKAKITQLMTVSTETVRMAKSWLWTDQSQRSNLPSHIINNNYSMSPSWIWSDKITNEPVARVGYNLFKSNKGEWNNCFSKFSSRALPPIFISTILQGGKFLNLAHYFPYDAKLRLLAQSRSFLANQKARNATSGAENLLRYDIFNLSEMSNYSRLRCK